MPTSPDLPERKPPRIDRPRMPAVYGVPHDRKGLLTWEHVSRRLLEAHVYWVATVSPDSTPHSTPVDGLWLDEALFFGGHPEAKRQRNLVENPAVCIHLESGTNVVILYGQVRLLTNPERVLTRELSAESKKKYGYGPEPEMYESSGVCIVRPRKILAWTQFPSDVTRIRFQ